ncbi:MAG: FAD/NAD(P)-binding protein [Acidimicrobiia bacterium]|nr:FAD/NAD(P)-binding protein [Acidimicrobiia bacterium]
MTTEPELTPVEPTAPLPYRVVGTERETSDTVTLALGPVRGALPAALPGQFHMAWAFGVGEAPVSVSGLAAGTGPVLHTVRAVGAVTEALARAEPGTVVGLRGPYGTSWGLDLPRGHDVVVVAGGLGLAPLRPAIRHLLAARDDLGRVVVLVGARSPADLLFARELERWRGRLDTDVEVTVDHAGPGWHGDVGVVTKLVSRIPFDAERTAALVCGPEVMMRFAAAALQDQGVAPDRIQVSLERNMHCAVALCGHCQLGPTLVCRDGPVLPYDRAAPLLAVREL